MRHQVDPQVLADACGAEPSWLCRQVLSWSDGNQDLARSADFLLARPARIVLVVVIAAVVNWSVRRAVRSFTDRVTGAHMGGGVRAAARAKTIGTVLRSGASAVIYAVALLLVLGELGIDLAPLIAGAGVAGIAFGFGAQSLVKDFLSGIFMLIEDQYGVGDVIDAGEATGTVESVSLRSTRLRDVHGTVWHIPNGEIRRVGNKSQQWARALLDVPVAHGTDVRQAETVIKRVADGLWRDPAFADRIIDEPEVLGVEAISLTGLEIRLVIKTRPAEQWKVLRELRVRLTEAFEAEGIKLPVGAAIQPAP